MSSENSDFVRDSSGEKTDSKKTDIIISFLIAIILAIIGLYMEFNILGTLSYSGKTSGLSIFYYIVNFPFLLFGYILYLISIMTKNPGINYILFWGPFLQIPLSIILWGFLDYSIARIMKNIFWKKNYYLLRHSLTIILIIITILLLIFSASGLNKKSTLEKCLSGDFIEETNTNFLGEDLVLGTPYLCLYEELYPPASSSQANQEELINTCLSLSDNEKVNLIEKEKFLDPISHQEYCIYVVSSVYWWNNLVNVCDEYGNKVNSNDKRNKCIKNYINHQFFEVNQRTPEKYWEYIRPICNQLNDSSFDPCNEEVVNKKFSSNYSFGSENIEEKYNINTSFIDRNPSVLKVNLTNNYKECNYTNNLINNLDDKFNVECIKSISYRKYNSNEPSQIATLPYSSEDIWGFADTEISKDNKDFMIMTVKLPSNSGFSVFIQDFNNVYNRFNFTSKEEGVYTFVYPLPELEENYYFFVMLSSSPKDSNYEIIELARLRK